MIKVEAPTLQEAYSKAAAQLSCSVIDLEINVLQNGSNGFLGMFKKNAIIEVVRKGSKPMREEREPREQAPRQAQKEREVISPQPQFTTPVSSNDERRTERNKRNKNRRNKAKNKESIKSEDTPSVVSPAKPDQHSVKEHRDIVKPMDIKPEISHVRETRHTIAATAIDQNFHHEKRQVNDVLEEVQSSVKNLFKYSCFTLDVPTVTKYDDETILIEFSGEDAALLIGKEGYRYKALSYLLYNWINLKYGLNIRLEIAEFLKNQEEMIEKYLAPVIERIRNSGRGQTKILDGVLIKIALESLRAAFPDKYVGIKSGKEGGKFIVVNDFNRKNS